MSIITSRIVAAVTATSLSVLLMAMAIVPASPTVVL